MDPRPEPETKSKGHDVLLGKYELGRLLGRGTFAKVYHARSLSDGSGVAIKVLDKPPAAAAASARILSEIAAMRRLSHPHILRLHEIMATRAKIYLVMDHAAGGDLLSRLARRGRLPEPAARRYFRQLLSALRFCHARGVAHRDVKPQNLLLDKNGDIQLSDFGLSALPDQIRDGHLHTSCGTPAYAAPEVLCGKGYDGARADAWSCGVILFVLLAGFLPFDDSNLALMYRKIHRRDFQFPPWFSPPAKKLVSRLLDPNPNTRISLDALIDLPWYKKPYSLDDSPPPRDSSRLGLAVRVPSMNAFDIISLSSGLDLSGLFDGGRAKERRFMSTASVEKIVKRISETGAKLGYSVERRAVVGAEKWGSSVLSLEVSEVASPLLLVEMKVEGGSGDGEGFCWGDLRAELGDIVFAWHNNGES